MGPGRPPQSVLRRLMHDLDIRSSASNPYARPDGEDGVSDAQATGGMSAAAPRASFDRPKTLASLQFPEYRNLFSAGIFIYVGVQAQQIARGQLAFELTGS